MGVCVCQKEGVCVCSLLYGCCGSRTPLFNQAPTDWCVVLIRRGEVFKGRVCVRRSKWIEGGRVKKGDSSKNSFKLQRWRGRHWVEGCPPPPPPIQAFHPQVEPKAAKFRAEIKHSGRNPPWTSENAEGPEERSVRELWRERCTCELEFGCYWRAVHRSDQQGVLFNSEPQGWASSMYCTVAPLIFNSALKEEEKRASYSRKVLYVEMSA